MKNETLKREYERIKKELRLLSGFKYPKLTGLLAVIIAAYFIFSNPALSNSISSLDSWGYLGVFIAGLFFTFGFTTPFAIGFFIVLNPENIWLAGLLGGFGAMLGDLLIFKLIRFSFMDEFERLKNTKTIKEFSRLIDKTLSRKLKLYFLYALAGIIISSPLPDEAGIILLAGLTRVKPSILAMLSFVFNTLGVLIFLSL